MTQLNELTLSLPNQRDCAISIGHGCCWDVEVLKRCIPSKNRLFILTQTVIYEKHGQAIETLIKEHVNADCHVITLPEGEYAKSFQTLQFIMDKLFTIGVERSDTVIALGGGVVTDCAGFVASICLRGIGLIQIPTTLLAQVDAAIGGKTGINHDAGKNLIGTFYQSQQILIDTRFLSSLSKREYKSGFAEVIKYGIIQDRPLFDLLSTHVDALSAFDSERHTDLWIQIITASCQNKISVVQQDEKEAGLRAILNFGHTIGHGLESLFDYHTYKHGECIIFGMVAATWIAVNKDLLSEKQDQEIYHLISAYQYASLKLDPVSLDDLMPIMYRDKKVKQKVLHFVLPTDIGQVQIIDSVTDADISASLDFVHTFFKGGNGS